jgi:hypothetical protein
MKKIFPNIGYWEVTRKDIILDCYIYEKQLLRYFNMFLVNIKQPWKIQQLKKQKKMYKFIFKNITLILVIHHVFQFCTKET